MATEVILPKLGMNMESARILRWLKREGDHVVTGEPLAEIETDKVNVELEAEAAGVLRKILVPEGEYADVNQIVAVIAAPEEDISEILARATISPQGAGDHVEQVYESWHHAPQDSPQEEAPRKLDPRAIRERLRQRGALPATPAPEPSRTRIVIYGAGLGAKQLLEVTRHLDTIEVVGLIDDNPDMRGGEAGGYRVLGGVRRAGPHGRFGRGGWCGPVLPFRGEAQGAQAHRPGDRSADHPPGGSQGHSRHGRDHRGRCAGGGRRSGGPRDDDRRGGDSRRGGGGGPRLLPGGTSSHLSPGCVLSGVVSLRENVLVGVGAAINSTVNVGRNVIIAPGAAVMNDVPDDVVVSGVPAKVIGESRRGEA